MANFTVPNRIETLRLIGYTVTAADLDYLVEVDSDLRVQRWLFGNAQTAEQSRARLDRWVHMWQRDGRGFWIFHCADDIVGHGGIFNSPRETGEVEVGYVIKPAHWGRGFATEIAAAALRVGFESLDLPRIIGIAQSANAPSRRVMEKCGMAFEADLPSPDGAPGVRYAISKETWRSQVPIAITRG